MFISPVSSVSHTDSTTNNVKSNKPVCFKKIDSTSFQAKTNTRIVTQTTEEMLSLCLQVHSKFKGSKVGDLITPEQKQLFDDIHNLFMNEFASYKSLKRRVYRFFGLENKAGNCTINYDYKTKRLAVSLCKPDSSEEIIIAYINREIRMFSRKVDESSVYERTNLDFEQTSSGTKITDAWLVP